MEKVKQILWILRYYADYSIRYWVTKGKRKELHIYNSERTIQEIINHRLSISRFGDGELQMMEHHKNDKNAESFKVDTFQNYSSDLANRLWEVFLSKKEKHLNCLPYQFKNASISRIRAKMFWQREWLSKYQMLDPNLQNTIFGDTNFTRFYMDRKDIVDYGKYVHLLQQIWYSRSILIVEGSGSRTGADNDLFSKASSISRIICPSRNAFERYQEIMEAVQANSTRDTLVLICLGHTATILAYDLSQIGYQAIDLGHVDVEYEWMRMNAKKKIAIPHRYVNEVAEGRIVSNNFDNEVYKSQIIMKIDD